MDSALFQNGEFSHPRSRPSVKFGAGFYRNFWMLSFLLLCTAIYFQKSRKRDAAIAEISLRLREMETVKTIAAKEREDLQLRLQSQGDPAWIEMVLMRDLGVVPEGWIKVQFRDCQIIK